MSETDTNIAIGPRILHLIPADGIGGVEVAAKSMLARSDLPCDFRLQFIEPSGPAGRTIASYAGVIKANAKALRNARAFKPDVILCSLWRSVPLALALRAIHRHAKLVYLIHLDSSVHAYDTILSTIAMRAADEIWGDSADVLMARRVPSGRSRVISFVIKRADFFEKAYSGPRFVSWGRLNRQKGFDRAIRLVGLLAEQGMNVQYDIYGPDGGERQRLIALVRDLKLEHQVTLPGPISQDALATIAARYSFFLQLSRSEGMCMAAVEAMQFGLVPVATAVGQMKHYVIPRKTGIVADPDLLDVAATEIAALTNDPTLWEKRSAAAMRFWHDAPLYADEVCRAATELYAG